MSIDSQAGYEPCQKYPQLVSNNYFPLFIEIGPEQISLLKYECFDIWYR